MTSKQSLANEAFAEYLRQLRKFALDEKTEPMDRQANLLTQDAQPDMFGPAPVQTYRPDPDKVRRRLLRLLSEARASQKMPWEPAIVTLYQTIFPQMSEWLPKEEGAQLRFEFEFELERLKAA